MKLEDLGRAKKITITRDTTTVVEGAGKKDAIQARVKQLRAQIEETTSDYDREKLQERLAKLVGGVAVIKVGAATETEMKEKKARVEDAMHATKAAVEEGIVPGGGVALLRCTKAVDGLALEGDEAVGVAIIRRALEEPLRQIATNAGHEGAVVVAKVREMKGDEGFNALHREVREPGRGGRHRSHQGRALRPAERGFHRLAAAHHRGDHLRDPRGQARGLRRRPRWRRHGWHVLSTYEGTRGLDGTTRLTVDERPSTARAHFREQTTTTFDWGYAGAGGPAQLALAILVDHLADADVARRHYEQFVRRVICKLPSSGWTLTASEIDAVLTARAAGPGLRLDPP